MSRKRQKSQGKIGKILCVFSITWFALASYNLAAFADQTQLSDDGNTYTITKTYMQNDGESTTSFVKEIEVDGKTFILKNKNAASIDKSYVHPTRTEKMTETKKINADELSSVKSIFDKTKTYDKDGYKGTLTQGKYTYEPIYQSNTRQVDKRIAIKNLPSNDVNQLSQTKAFTISSDASYGATTKATLKLSDVSWKVTQKDEYGIPTKYTAYLNYRGQEKYLVIKGYSVTMNYKGKVTAEENQMTVTATYVKKSLPWWQAAVAGAAAAAAAGIIATVILRRRRRASVIEVQGEKEKVIDKLKVKKDGTQLNVNIPEDIVLALTPGNEVWLEMPKCYLDAGYTLTVTQSESDGSITTVFSGTSERRVRLVNPISDAE